MGEKIKICIVKDCGNKSNEGNFNGDICSACYKYLTTGIIGPTNSFLKGLKND